jgi:hypothetical protein
MYLHGINTYIIIKKTYSTHEVAFGIVTERYIDTYRVTYKYVLLRIPKSIDEPRIECVCIGKEREGEEEYEISNQKLH